MKILNLLLFPFKKLFSLLKGLKNALFSKIKKKKRYSSIEELQNYLTLAKNNDMYICIDSDINDYTSVKMLSKRMSLKTKELKDKLKELEKDKEKNEED
jgi:hypothetical protein